MLHYKKQGQFEAISFVKRLQATNDITHTTMGQPSSISDHPKTVLDHPSHNLSQPRSGPSQPRISLGWTEMELGWTRTDLVQPKTYPD